MSGEHRPASASRAGLCPLCGADLDSNSSACRRCGATSGRVSQCVHCRTTAAIRPHVDLGWVCEVCGGARLVQSVCEQEASVSAHLASATRSFRFSRLLRMASWIAAVFGAGTAMTLLLARLAFSPGAGTMTTLSMIPICILLGSVVGFARAKALKSETALNLELALGSSLLKLVSEFPEGATAAQLANRLEISPTRAEQLLTRLNVRDDVQSIVTDDGQLLFQARSSFQSPFGDSHPQADTAQLRVSNDSDQVVADDETSEGSSNSRTNA
jgi:hypothetical protein